MTRQEAGHAGDVTRRPTIVLSSGPLTDAAVHGAQTAALRDRGLEVVEADVHGGDTFAGLAAIVAAAVEGVADPVVAMGASTGATASLAFAFHHRDRCAALVLIRPSLLFAREDLAAIEAPTLIVGMPGDPGHPIEVAEAYWRHIPTSRLISQTPGDVPLEARADDLAAAVERFADEVLPR